MRKIPPFSCSCSARSDSRQELKCWLLQEREPQERLWFWMCLTPNASWVHRSRSQMRCDARLEPCIATSRNANAAVMAARGCPGITVVPPGEEAQRLSPLSLAVLELE